MYNITSVIFKRRNIILEITTDPEMSCGSCCKEPGEEPSLHNIADHATKETFYSLVGAHSDQFGATEHLTEGERCRIIKSDALMWEKVPEPSVPRVICKSRSSNTSKATDQCHDTQLSELIPQVFKL
jgi:Fe-S-cluster containining protein